MAFKNPHMRPSTSNRCSVRSSAGLYPPRSVPHLILTVSLYFLILVVVLTVTQDTSQTHKRFRRTLIYQDTNTQSAHFRGNPLCQATKLHLTDKRLETMRSEITYLFGWVTLFSCPALGKMFCMFPRHVCIAHGWSKAASQGCFLWCKWRDELASELLAGHCSAAG